MPADSGWKLTDAYAINERGQIAGSGFKDGQLRAFLLMDNTPPELQLPADVAREATSKAGAEVHYGSPSASDSVDGSVPVTCDPPSGSTFGLGGRRPPLPPRRPRATSSATTLPKTSTCPT